MCGRIGVRGKLDFVPLATKFPNAVLTNVKCE